MNTRPHLLGRRMDNPSELDALIPPRLPVSDEPQWLWHQPPSRHSRFMSAVALVALSAVAAGAACAVWWPA